MGKIIKFNKKISTVQAVGVCLVICILGNTTTNLVLANSTDESPKFSSAGASVELPAKDLVVEDVTVEGNRLVPTEHILDVIKTKRGDKFDRDQVVQDLKAVNNMGYFDDRGLQAIPELSGNGVLLKIKVVENAPVTQFAFQGNSVISCEDLAKLFANQLGKPQNLTQLSAAIDKVEAAYHEKGYTLARVLDVKDDPDGSVQLQIDEGVLNSIQVTGNKKTKDFIIRNAIKLKSGSVYNEKQLTTDLRKLFANGYFQDIRRSLSPSPANPDKYDLKVEVDERRTGSVGLGGGIDTVSGPFGSFSVADSNFQGRGQVLSFHSQIGTGLFNSLNNSVNNGGSNFIPNVRTYQVEASFIEPNLRGTDTSMTVTGFGKDLASMVVDDSLQRSIGASVSFSKPLTEHLSANLSFLGENVALQSYATTAFTDYLNTRVQELGLAPNGTLASVVANNLRQQQLKGGTYFGIKPALAYDTRDGTFDPHRGTLAKLTASPNLGLSGSSFFKLGASVSQYVPVTNNTTLALNAQANTGFGAMPQFTSYQLGGFNGMRGYRMFSDLGAGTGLLMGTAELRFKLPIPGAGPSSKGGNAIANAIQNNVRGVVFSDFGKVTGNDLYNNLYQRNSMGASIGIGLRFKIPHLGVIRIDYGFPLISTALGHLTPRLTVGFGDKF